MPRSWIAESQQSHPSSSCKLLSILPAVLWLHFGIVLSTSLVFIFLIAMASQHGIRLHGLQLPMERLANLVEDPEALFWFNPRSSYDLMRRSPSSASRFLRLCGMTAFPGRSREALLLQFEEEKLLLFEHR